MKLQFIVVETGERWRRALLRMVMDSRSGNHSDYGSFQSSDAQHSIENTNRSNQLKAIDDHSSLSDNDENVNLTSDMTQSDLYQRQPLLSPSCKTESWSIGKDRGNGLSASSECYDSDETAVHRNGALVNCNGNGVVKIDIPSPSREEPRFPKEKWKTLLAFFILVINFILTTVSLALVHERVPDRDIYGPLPDVILDNVKAMDWALDFSEILIIIGTNAAFLVIIFHKHKFIILRRVFLLLSLLYLMRSVTMYVTVLPVSSKTYYCSPKMNATNAYVVAKRVLQLLSGFGLSINQKHSYCGDYIYSGHTVMLVMSYLIIAEYSPRRCFPLHWMSFILSTTGVVMVLLAHGHYTVDVLIAYYVVTTLYYSYHTLANNAYLKQQGPNNFLARMWWFRVFLFFEKNVSGPVPRQYEWPLPWPRHWRMKHPNRNS